MSRRLGFILLSVLCGASCTCASEESSEEVIVEPAPAPAGGSTMTPEVRAALLAGVADEPSPDEYRAVLETTKGAIEVSVHRAWSPAGADRFYTLVKHGYFNDIAFFRVIPGFMAQFGMAGDPAINGVWSARTIMDEPVVQSNLRGRITFAKTGMPNSRSNQFFINFSAAGKAVRG